MCLALRIRHPHRLLAILTPGELYDWQRYASQFGLPPRRNDLHWGMLQSLVYNSNRSPESDVGEPRHFMPYLPEDEPDPAELREKILGNLRRVKPI